MRPHTLESCPHSRPGLLRSVSAAGAFALAAACAHAPSTGAAAGSAPAASSATSTVAPVQPHAPLAAAMARVAFMRGTWVGIAEGTKPDGTPYKVTQTERMGPMLGGDVIVIEGRGYESNGTTGFNAFAVLSFNMDTQKYELRSYAQGLSGTFELKPSDAGNGYTWEIPAGPGAVMRFTATVTSDHWREVGEVIAPGQPPVHAFEMNLTRTGDTDWPLGTPVSPTAPPSTPAP